MMNTGDIDKLVNDILKADQLSEVNDIAVAIKAGKLNFLGFIENLRSDLVARDADLRSIGINKLCAVLIRLEFDRDYELEPESCMYLLNFLLSKVEVSVHIVDLLLVTIKHLIIRNYGTQNSLGNEQLDKILNIMFENNGVQSYGQRDRLLLYAIFEYLLDTHYDQLILLATRRTIMAFFNNSNGEREPRVLLPIFRIHKRLCSRMELGLLVEDMFELVACYFPIDYEPNDPKKGPFISREMLRYSLVDCLTSANEFGSFCIQMIAEKLIETDSENDNIASGEGTETALIKRQLEICEFFIICCQRFTNIGNILEQNLDNLMTGFRLIFMNPTQNKLLIEQCSKIVCHALQLTAQKLDIKTMDSHSHATDPLLNMVETTLENIEPFILQTQMGMMGNAFQLLQCMTQSNILPFIDAIVPRALYWLKLLINGQTLGGTQNREEIALKAIEFIPFWIRKNAGMSTSIVESPSTSKQEALESTIMPLLDEVVNSSIITDQRKFIEMKCRIFSSLLLPLSTISDDDSPSLKIYSSLLKQNRHFNQMVIRNFQEILSSQGFAWSSSASNDTIYVKQFLALLATSGIIVVSSEIEKIEIIIERNHDLIEILTALIHPLSSELEGRKLEQSTPCLYNSKEVMKFLMGIAFVQIYSTTNDGRKQSKTIYYDTIRQIARRIINSRLLVKEFLDELRHKIVEELQQNSDKSTGIFKLDNLFGELIQDIGSMMFNDRVGFYALHAEFCGKMLEIIQQPPTEDFSLRPVRFFWLYLIQNKEIRHVELLFEKILTSLNSNNWMNDDEVFLQEALYGLYFAIFNRHSSISLSTKMEISSIRNRLTQSLVVLKGRQLPPETDQKMVEMIVNLQLELLETRSTLLTNQSTDETAKTRLEEFLEKMIAMTKDEIGTFLKNINIEELLNFSSLQNNPEKCFYERTFLWQQRVFCNFTTIYVNYLDKSKQLQDNTSTQKRAALINLLSPLMSLSAQLPHDSLRKELAQLAPIIIDTLPLALLDVNQDQQWKTTNSSPSFAIRLLDGVRLLLENKEPSSSSSSATKTMTDGHLSERDLGSIVNSLARFCLQQSHEKSTIDLQAASLDCLGQIAELYQDKKEWLSPYYTLVIRALTEMMEASRKRFIRHKIAFTRNSWELVLG